MTGASAEPTTRSSARTAATEGDAVWAAAAAVEACVGAISQTVAMLPVYHYRERPDGGMDVIKNSAAARVLRNTTRPGPC